MTKIIKLDSNGGFPLDLLSDLVDIEKVESYTFKVNKDETITLKLYDKKGKLVKPHVK